MECPNPAWFDLEPASEVRYRAAGTLNVTGRVAASEFRVANTAGYGKASVFITDNVVITRSGSVGTLTLNSGWLLRFKLGSIGASD